MIDALDYTLEQLLRQELDVEDGEIEISFSQPNGQWAVRRTVRTVNLFLYDVRENPALRHHQWQQTAAPGGPSRTGPGRSDPARTGAAAFKRTPLMLDCFYLVTAWSGADEAKRATEEHRLLSHALWVLAQYPVLNPTFEELERAEALAGVGYGDENARVPILLERRARGQKSHERDVQRRAWLNDPDLNPLLALDMEVRARLAQPDVLTNPAEVWSALEAQLKAGFSYVVTLPLNPWRGYETERVRQQHLRFWPLLRGAADGRTADGRAADGRAADGRAADGGALTPDSLYTIGGVIRDGAGTAQAGLRLHLLHGPAAEHAIKQAIEQATEQATAQANGVAAKDAAKDAAHRYITTTGAAGEYRFADLPPGTYTLLIQQAAGAVAVREFTLSPAGPTGFDFTI
jgi:hypothetical protein